MSSLAYELFMNRCISQLYYYIDDGGGDSGLCINFSLLSIYL